MPRGVPKAGAAKAGGGQKKKNNGYSMPKKLPVGSILQDTAKVQWVSGPSIGVGGFGEIYSACRADARVKSAKDYPNVIKIEPHGNGPLFVEMHFYMRNAKLEDIQAFKKSHGLKHLGMPNFIASGSHELEKEKHRFVVMPRYGSDIWDSFKKNGNKFQLQTAYRVSLQILDVLEYIHGCGYVHADIKGANILRGLGKDGESQVFLVDFGLAAHFTTQPEYKKDPKKMHNGTIEYTSRDAHNGVPTMRGDLEILAFNLIHWSGAKLPWESVLTDPVKVQELKEKHMSSIPAFLKACYPKEPVPKPVQELLTYTADLLYNQKPDYGKCKKILLNGLAALKVKDTGPLDFEIAGTSTKKQGRNSSIVISDEDSPVAVPKNPRKGRKLPSEEEPGENGDEPDAKQTKRSARKRPQKVYTEESDEEESTPKKSKKTKGASATLHLGTPSKNSTGKAQKVYQFNIDLDVSVDADVVVKLNRKDRKKPEKVQEEDEDSFVVEKSTKVRTKKNETSEARKEAPHIPTSVVRAGEYKGKLAKS